MARVFAKFPSSKEALDISFQTIPLCTSSLPRQAPPILTEIQMNALEALSAYDFSTSPSLIAVTLRFLVILWSRYTSSLPASCNMKHFGQFIVVALTPELGTSTRVQEAIDCGKEFVTSLMRLLSDSQLQALEKEGVYRQLRLLAMNYDVMSAGDLLQIVIGVGTFAEVTTCAMEFLEENSYLGFIHSALKYPSNESIQALIWQLFTILCKFEKKFAEGLFETDILSSVLTLLQTTDSLMQPPVRFLSACCQTAPLCVNKCLHCKPLVTHLLGMLEGFTSETSMQTPAVDAACLCDLLSLLCKTEPANVGSIMELKIVPHLEDYARVQPKVGLLPACIAIESLVNAFPPNAIINLAPLEFLTAHRTEFSAEDHHLFFKDLLSNPVVSSNIQYVKLMYITLQKLLKAFTAEAVKKVHTKEFLEFYSVCFIRDTAAFPSLITRIVFTTHFYIFEMRNKDPIAFLSDLNFHTTIASLLENSMKSDVIATILGLLACSVGKYYEYLKDVKPFLKAQVPNMLLDKARVFGKVGSKSMQFCDDFGRIMLNLTADKEFSLELYEQGYLERLVEMFEEKAMMEVRRSMIHAIGNIALGGQSIKQVLLDKQFYLKLLSILRAEGKAGNPFLLSACCRVLHILASGDWAKRKFVECGCVDVLLSMMRVRKDNPEICWRPLGLLSSLGFMAVTNRRYVLTDEVLEVVSTILKESTHGKVISYTTLVFLGIDELDQGAKKLRELGVGDHLQMAIDKPEYRKQAPDLERWGVHVLEKQNLYTISIPIPSPGPTPPLTLDHLSDWPPYIPLEDPDPTSADASIVRRLLPLDDASFKSYTPLAPEVSASVKSRLAELGLNPDRPLFRIGRMYGSTHGLCSNCDKECSSEELVIRPLSMTAEHYQHLIDNGWYRRGGVKMFRLRRNHNIECCDWETRVLVSEFNHKAHKSYKKVLRRMPVDRLTVETVPARFIRESFDLYNDYHIKKHDKPLKSEYSYCEHVVNTPTTHQTVGDMEYGTYHQLYRLDGKLVAIGIIDIVPKGLVSIYMWYNVSKEVSRLSFGVYSALKEIELVKELSKKNPEMKYYYLQGWNGNNKKLNYKANYEPEEFYCPCIVSGWISSLDGVAKTKEGVIAARESAKKSTENKQSEEMITDPPPPPPPPSEAGNKDSKEIEEVPTKENHEDKLPTIECEALPVDIERYQQVTGQNTVDISKIVVCVNYSQYMHLEDLFQYYDIGGSQREIMETRVRELFVALSPDLRNQLVIDVMASTPRLV